MRDYLCDDRPVITNAYLRKNAFHTLKVQNCYEIKLESLLMSEGFLNRPCEQDIDVGEVKLEALETRLKAVKSFAIKIAAPILFLIRE